jgi:hypothetical protein
MRQMFFAAAIAGGLMLSGFQAAPPQGDPREALARRYVQVSMQGMEKVVLAAVAAEMASLPDDMEAEHRAWLGANAGPILLRHMQPLVDAMIADHATRFTEAELRALAEFYDSPTGRAIAFKQMEYGAASGAQMGEFQMGYLTELLTKFCAEFTCPDQAAASAPANKPARR